MAKKITQEQVVQTDLWKNTIDSTKSLLKLITTLNTELKKTTQVSKDALKNNAFDSFEGLKKTDEEVKKINKSYKEKLKLEKDRTTLLTAQLKAEQQAEKQRQSLRKKAKKEEKDALDRRLKNAQKLINDKKSKAKELKSIQDKEVADKQKANKEKIKSDKKSAKAEQDAIKTAQKTRKSTIDNANAFKKLTKQTNNAQARFKRLAAQYGQNDKRTKEALNTFNKLDNRLRSINQTAKDGRRDVGRYSTAFGKLGKSLKNIALGLGIVQAIRGIGRAFADAFRRVREFDKELQNIAGITGTTRESLKDLEKSIIDVASSSIKTSNEVAKLATTLFTLGKTKEEVKILLKPVNDLSIAFRVSSEEAADFLGQTLNAFGKSANSAQRYADIIANVRTSTSLDFERIKDGLGFIAPTANALNLSLGETAALLGVLQDSGIRAARAGRLLNSSFARILEKGLTLEQALTQINESQDKVITSSDLFGKEALALGIVLAENTDKTKRLANEFDNLSRGSLKKLTDEQLGSLDAKIKILDSSYEQFILQIENGTGRIGKAIGSSIENLTKLINFVSNAEKTRTKIVTDEAEKRAARIINGTLEEVKSQEEAAEKLKNLRNSALINLRQYDADVGKAQRELFTALRDEAEKTGNTKLKQSLEQIKKAFDDNVLGLRETQTRLNALANQGDILDPFFGVAAKFNETLGDLIVNNEDLNTANTKVSLAVRERIEEEKLLEMINIKLLESEENLKKKTDGKLKADKEIIGLINKQAAAVADLNKQIRESVRENRGADNLVQLNAEYAAAVKELERLRRTAFSTRKEFDKQQRDLIENEFDKRIEEEVVKSKKTQDLITTNATASEEEKSLLLLKEQKRSADEINKINFERAKKEIDDNEELQLKLFKQSKRAAESEEDFKIRLKAKKEQLDIEALDAEIALRKQFFGEVLTREIDQLKLAEELKSFETIKQIKKNKKLTDEQKDIAIIEEEMRSNKVINLLDKQLKEGTSLVIEELDARKAEYTKFAEEKKKIDIDYFEVLRTLNEKYFTDQLNKTDNQISALQRRQQFLQDSAAQGNRDAAASLAINQKEEANAIKKREDLLQREKQVEFGLAIIESFRTELANEDNKTTAEALGRAVASTSVLTSFISSLPSFYDGTVDTGSNGSLDSNGGHLAVLHDNERVVDKKNNAKFGGISNDLAADIVHDFNNDLLSYNTPQLMVKQDRFDTNQQILNKFDNLEKSIVSAINNKETYLGSDIDTMKKLILQNYKKGNTKTQIQSKYRIEK